MLCQAAAALLLVAAPGAAADWVRIHTPRVEILTDAGEKAGRTTLDRFEQIQAVFPPPNAAAGSQPLRVFLFNSEKEFRSYTDGPATGGFYQSGAERDYVVLRTGAPLARAVAHEYVHWMLNHGNAPLPLWFEEGTAELYSNLALDRGGLHVGTPIREHLDVLAAERWLTAGELASANLRSSLYNERSLTGVFYAESWLLAHMLNLAPAWREGMPRFAELLAGWRESSDAFREAFGRTMEQAMGELRGYPGRLRGAAVAAPEKGVPQAAMVEALDPIAAILARADLALHVEHGPLARTLFEQAAKSQPSSAAAEAGLGSLALAEDRRAEARSHFEKAIAMGTRDAETYFQLATLERDAGAPKERVTDLLDRALALNPDFAEAHFLLGIRASDEGRYEAAVVHMREAVRVLPRESSFWNALAYAQAKLGQSGAARESALRAVRTALTPEQERMGEALLGSLP